MRMLFSFLLLFPLTLSAISHTAQPPSSSWPLRKHFRWLPLVKELNQGKMGLLRLQHVHNIHLLCNHILPSNTSVEYIWRHPIMTTLTFRSLSINRGLYWAVLDTAFLASVGKMHLHNQVPWDGNRCPERGWRLCSFGLKTTSLLRKIRISYLSCRPQTLWCWLYKLFKSPQWFWVESSRLSIELLILFLKIFTR